ncbi:amino acid/polyamine/organocation transporter (APC superfamily) [Luteibacter rhizovicinus]|uniref:Amino acid/polyamine/organocation transporter (APC superfamily) n=1 Tax=Luteibacter rhizovicinus TaxID=242606 RepID=A0A4R3Z1C8_9GAMM|nr:amino acid permease [Luteibacter rhizovicinus]TCV97654.1 amino acid/polyamine/organocation transporter (APC superfamily) [Luteibacter rhizovicinus]
MGLMADMTRRKSVETMQREVGERSGLRRILGLWQLTAIGLGGIIGVGIFVLTGTVAATQAGPAVVLSFLIAGIASAAAALCYAEFAGLIPVSGSAYTYGYAVLGEFVGWIIGWDLLLEYALIAAVVAVGWSGYVQALLEAAGIPLPVWAQGAYGSAPGRLFNLPAVVISLAITAVLAMRMQWGARFNTLIVAIKIAAAALIVIAGVAYVKPERWHPFMPFGMHGVVTGAAVVFFAVFGYDMLTTAAEEAKNPQRDLPRAVLLSLGIAMALYFAICLVLTGIVPYTSLDNAAPVAGAFTAIGLPQVMVAISLASVCGITSVIFANLMAGARIWFALARDGLLPGWFAKVHPRWHTPHRTTFLLGLVTAVASGLFPLDELAKLVNIGVLGAFIVICSAVAVLRWRRPELERPFRTPLVPLVPIIGVGFSCWLIWGLPGITYVRFALWLVLGGIVYFAYGRRHSRLAVHN